VLLSLWRRLHTLAALRAAGLVGAQMVQAGLFSVATQLDKICGRCGSHFRSQLNDILHTDPAKIERVLYELHARASGESAGDAYRAPEFGRVRAHYRAAVVRSALLAENWVDLTSTMGEATVPVMSATFNSPDSAM